MMETAIAVTAVAAVVEAVVAAVLVVPPNPQAMFK
jgi:hypothetical protein